MGGSDSTTTQPWKGQRSYLSDIFGQAQQLAGQPREYYDLGPRVAGRGATSLEGERAGLEMIRGTDTAALGGADRYLADVLSGRFISPESNPWLREMADISGQETTRHYQRAVAPYITQRGRGGEGAEMNRARVAQEALAQELYEGQTGLFGRHYADERGRMTAALTAAPGVSAARRADVTTGYALGEGAERYEQRVIDDLIRAFEFERDEPWDRLQRYSDIVQRSGAIGGQSSVSRGFGASEGVGMATGIMSMIMGLASMCSRAIKDEIDGVNVDRILENVEKLPLAIWKYKDEIDAADHQPHIGPYAEDMVRLFGLGDGKTIFLMDAIGICLASIQALSERVKHLEEQILAGEITIPVDVVAEPELEKEAS